MKKKATRPFQKRILLSILLPVLAVGAAICLVSTSLITPPILDDIRSRIEIRSSCAASVMICVFIEGEL